MKLKSLGGLAWRVTASAVLLAVPGCGPAVPREELGEVIFVVPDPPPGTPEYKLPDMKPPPQPATPALPEGVPAGARQGG
jgi:hypothetical protein